LIFTVLFDLKELKELKTIGFEEMRR